MAKKKKPHVARDAEEAERECAKSLRVKKQVVGDCAYVLEDNDLYTGPWRVVARFKDKGTAVMIRRIVLKSYSEQFIAGFMAAELNGVKVDEKNN